MNKISVAEYRVVPNIVDDQTHLIQQAIDDMFLLGGGEVSIPTGEYHIGTLRLRSNVTLHLMEDTILIASRNVNDYFKLKYDTIEPVDEYLLDESPWERGCALSSVFDKWGSRWHNGIIRAINAENVSLIGEKGSVIDGSNCFDEVGEEYYRGPHGISITNCKNVTLKGYTVRHAGNWANMLQDSSNILAENLTVYAGHDGIHGTTCDDLIIRNCHFYTGDDCIGGFDYKNVLIEDCELNSACSALRVGGTDILVQRCYAFAPALHKFRGRMTMEDKRAGLNSNDTDRVKPGFEDAPPRNNMLSFFTYYSDHTVKIRNTPGNIVIRDCVIKGSDSFLHFNFSGNEMWQNNRPLTSISFENVKVSGIASPLIVYGDEKECLKLSMRNFEFSFREGMEDTTFMYMANVGVLDMENVTVHNAENAAFIKMWGEIEPKCRWGNVTTNTREELIVRATENFTCRTI